MENAAKKTSKKSVTKKEIKKSNPALVISWNDFDLFWKNQNQTLKWIRYF
jgi:hypothetical protein